MAKIKIATALLGGLLASAYAGGAQADVAYTDFTNGQTSFSTNGFDITASPSGFFEIKNHAGSSGVGISTGAVNGEIDGSGDNAEYIRFVSNIGERLLSSFSVAFLYQANAFQDSFNEEGSITIGLNTYTLAVTNATAATFTLGGVPVVGATVTNNSPGSSSGGGVWTVSFANPLSFSLLQFSPGNGGPDSELGDYSFGSLTLAAVPGPIVGAGLPGLVMALGGLVMLARRRRSLSDTV